MRSDLLRLVVEKLKTVEDETFDMGVWKKEMKCGTVCCAIGHACDIPEVQARGLALELVPGGSWWRPVFKETKTDGFAAVAQAFELKNRSHAEFLFDSDTYDSDPSRQDVIERIEEYVLSNGRTADAYFT